MPGLQLGARATATATGQARYGTVPNPSTASEAAYGLSQGGPSIGLAALAPTNAGGLAFWIGITGVAILAGLYWSLPG